MVRNDAAIIESGAPPSRTRKKRDAQEIEDLAAELMALSVEDVRALPVPDALKHLIREGFEITAHGARKRHRKYVAKHLRGPFAEALDALRAHMAARHGSRQADIQKEKYLAGLRDRLLFPDSCEKALDELETRFPDEDLTGVKDLVRKNLKTEQRRYAREIYRLIVSLWERDSRHGVRANHERNT